MRTTDIGYLYDCIEKVTTRLDMYDYVLNDFEEYAYADSNTLHTKLIRGYRLMDVEENRLEECLYFLEMFMKPDNGESRQEWSDDIEFRRNVDIGGFSLYEIENEELESMYQTSLFSRMYRDLEG